MEIGSHSPGRGVVSERNQHLFERLSLNTKLMNRLLRRHNEHNIFRADAHRIANGIGEAAGNGAPCQEQACALSGREREVVRFLANGKSNKEIAATLCISVKTVESYRARVFLKLKLDSFASLVRYAIRAHIVEI